jgi:NhaP-type Na+/H+ or K+/H+ antiporter
VEHLLLGLAGIIALGIAAQWLSWRLRLPAILLLLVVGFLAGPVTGFIDPTALFGDLLFPIVALSVAVILFEGGLSLDIAELRDVGRVVRNLISVGVLTTWVLVAGLAYTLLELRLELAILFGALLVVTGPTVIVPLLRHIRPSPRVGSAVKWEGIVNDPIGAILAVLVFEAIVAGGFEQGLAVAAGGVLRATLVGGGLGLAGAALIVLLLRRYWVPDYLQSPVALGTLIFVFTLANRAQEESGLLAVTVMGAALASQTLVSIRPIVQFKENLRVLLISILFILLAARLPLTSPDYWGSGSLLFLGALVLLVRPIAVALSTWRSKFTWRERVFLGFMAPRGIVAAAVASIFAIDLVEFGDPTAARLVPLTFLVIVGTVGVYGLLAPIAARLLAVATPNPQGLLIIGASPWARAVAGALHDSGVKVVLADSNWANAAAARRQGLKAIYANVLTDRALDELELELDGVGRLLALTPNDEVNALATLHFGETFDRAHVYQLPPPLEERRRKASAFPKHLRGRFLFRNDATFENLSERFAGGGIIKRTHLTDEFDFDTFREHYGDHALPMFVIRGSKDVAVVTAADPPAIKPGHILISLVCPPDEQERAAAVQNRRTTEGPDTLPD